MVDLDIIIISVAGLVFAFTVWALFWCWKRKKANPDTAEIVQVQKSNVY